MSWSFPSHARTGAVICGHDDVDEDGNPTGGYAEDSTDGPAGWPQKIYRMLINWQRGPVNRAAGEQPNGAFVEDVFEAGIRRLQHYQKTKFACPENEEAIMYAKKAIYALTRRRDDREARGVQGQNKA